VRLSRMADAVPDRLDRGELTSPAERAEAGRASRPCRAIYPCVSCHLPRPNLPAIFHDGPR